MCEKASFALPKGIFRITKSHHSHIEMTSLVFEEINTYANASTELAIVGVLAERLVVIERWLNGHRAAHEECVADLEFGHDVVIVVIGVYQLGIKS